MCGGCLYMFMHIKRFIMRTWLMFMEAAVSKICSEGWQAGDAGEVMARMKSEGSRLQNSLWLRETVPFILFISSTDWIWTTHIMEETAFLEVH